MSDLIFHHYAKSPFAEKVRLMFGLKNLKWRSCDAPDMLPKPELQALTGGYRRIPVLQIGADIYCDTALITDVLEGIQPTPSLYPASKAGKALARTVAAWADDKLFAGGMAYNFAPAGAAAFAAKNPNLDLKAFGADRQAMRGGAPRMYPGDATASYKSYLRKLNAMLTDSPFVLGDAPCVADLSYYHPLWFTRHFGDESAEILKIAPNILPWMDRVAALGHGQRDPIEVSRTESVQIAKRATPASVANDVFMDEHGISLGAQVSIKAESFGLEVTEGELIAATRTRYTLRRTDPAAGTVHVHFPRIGFVLKKMDVTA